MTAKTGAAFLLMLLCGDAAAAEVERVQYVMGTLLRVQVEGTQPERLAEAIFAEVGRWDRLLSTYKPESDISRVNALAPEKVTVSTSTWRALEAALDWSRRTGGAFDVTVGPLVTTWGFNGTPRLPANEEIEAAQALVSHASVGLHPPRQVSLARVGMALDFGAIGKGWALDRALEAALSAGGAEEIVMDFGGQLLFWSARPRTWPAAVRHPEKEGDTTAKLTLRQNGSLSTSSSAERFFVAPSPWKGEGGSEGEKPRRYGHILDPRTGYPAEPCQSVTVWAPTAEAADALSTALFVMGPDAGLRFADAEDVAALIVYSDTRGGATSVGSKSWRETIDAQPSPPFSSFQGEGTRFGPLLEKERFGED